MPDLGGARTKDTQGLLPSGSFLTPEEMRFRKDQDNAAALTLDLDVRGCTGLADAERVAWHVWFGQWAVFYKTPVPPVWNMVSLVGHARALERFEGDLRAWRSRVKGDGCKVSGIEPPAPPCSGPMCYVPRGTLTFYTTFLILAGVGLYVAHKKGWLKEGAKIAAAAI